MLCGALPDLALLPLFVYWFGPGGMAAICMASVCSFFPIFFTVREGVKDIPKDYFFVTTVYGAKKFAVYKKLVLPAVFPQLVTGLRLAFDFVWEIVLAIEIMASVAGIGSFISLSVEEGSLENAFAGIIMIGLIAIAIDRVVFQHLEAKIGRWHE
jgi:ABC-type nitrate/sulfonate/bicarbonate transport system permease component